MPLLTVKRNFYGMEGNFFNILKVKEVIPELIDIIISEFIYKMELQKKLWEVYFAFCTRCSKVVIYPLMVYNVLSKDQSAKVFTIVKKIFMCKHCDIYVWKKVSWEFSRSLWKC